MIGFGGFEGLLKGVELASTISADPSMHAATQHQYTSSKPMFPHLAPMNESVASPNQYQPHRNNNPVSDSELDALLGSIGDFSDPFMESSTSPSPIEQKSAIDTPKPRPAVSQTAFVNAAIKAKSVASVDTTKQKLPEQTKVDLVKMDAEFNAKLASKGTTFKKYLVENITTDDNTHLIEAISKIFDIIVLESE
jgi:hypothetical protein